MSTGGPNDPSTQPLRPSDLRTTERPAHAAGRYAFLGPPQAADEIGRFDDYRVLRLLGSGGSGLVFAAEELSLRRPVALKVLKPEQAADPDNRTRFLREARAAAEIHSDHVVTVLRVGEAAGLPFLVMPLLAGETLQARIDRTGPLDPRSAIVIARDTASGLAAAHARGLVHRDIKPGNIWLETNGAGGPLKRARILDFGLARRPRGESGLTNTGFILGTLNYLAPEQAAGGEFDHRVDLFALGCVVYAMLTGESPFPGTSPIAVLTALANAEPEPVTAKNPAVPPAVADLVRRLLQKNPKARFQTAAEVGGVLDAILAGDLPTSAATLALPGLAPGRTGAETARPGGSATWADAPTDLDRQPASSFGWFRRRRVALAGFGGALALAAVAVFAFRAPPEPVVVGVLHSQSGTMAVSENPVIDATLLAVEEVNAAGGVRGRLLRPVVVDAKSDPEEFAVQADRLLTQEHAAAVFGCWTSASRKAVRSAFERHGGLLFYPVQYEGLEQSPRIVYLGPAPNQQLIPAVDFVVGTLKKKRIALVGSDYIFPRTAHAIIRDRVLELRAAGSAVEVVGEVLIPLGSGDVSAAVQMVRLANADVVINTINGSTNGSFFARLRDPVLGLPGVTTLSVSITENEVRGLNPPALTDDYLVASYFQAVDRPESRAFLDKIRTKYGADRTTSDMMAAAYCGVHLWAKAATAARSTDPAAVAAAVRGLSFDGPGARVTIDPENQHAWLPVRIGKVRPNGQVEVVPGAGSEEPIRPVPFPPTRTPAAWDQFLRGWEMEWGGKWTAPAKK